MLRSDASPGWLDRVLTGVVFGMLLLGLPAAVQGHAELVLASPEPGVGLAQAPAAVVVKFSEPLNVGLSRIEVLDASVADVGQAPTEPVSGDTRAMRRPLGLLPTGQYTVRWTSVSALDGHILRGSYAFAVGTGADPHTTVADSPLDSEGPLGLVGRFAALMAIAMWFGALLLGRVSIRAGVSPTVTARVARVAPAVAVIGTSLSLVSTTLIATGSLTKLGNVLQSPSGEARSVVLIAAIAGFLIGARWSVVALLLAGMAIAAEAASGHAAASVLPPVAIVSFATHFAAVGIWVFAIAASLLAAPDVRRALATFTPYAVTAAAVTAATGLVNGVLEIADPADLLGTGYGTTLVFKSLAFIVMAWFGSLHYLWRRRRETTDGALRVPLRAEASAALVALVLATLLVGFPNPPREAEASASSLSVNDPMLTDLAGREALSIADESGPFIVGLTILPPRPGPAEIRVQVLGVEAGDALHDARFSATGGDGSVQATLGRPCGLGCFAGDVMFAGIGDRRLEVDIASNRGPISISASVPMPAADGSATFADALTAQEGLRAASLTERLHGAGGPVVVATYRLQAPDRAAITVGDSTQILAGQAQFRRTGNAPWTKSPFPPPGFSWPTRYFRDFWHGAAAIRSLGTETVDGVSSDVVAFVRPDVPAWFRIWVGQSDRLVRRVEMRADGHVMDQSYADLNGPIIVELPAAP